MFNKLLDAIKVLQLESSSESESLSADIFNVSKDQMPRGFSLGEIKTLFEEAEKIDSSYDGEELNKNSIREKLARLSIDFSSVEGLSDPSKASESLVVLLKMKGNQNAEMLVKQIFTSVWLPNLNQNTAAELNKDLFSWFLGAAQFDSLKLLVENNSYKDNLFEVLYHLGLLSQSQNVEAKFIAKQVFIKAYQDGARINEEGVDDKGLLFYLLSSPNIKLEPEVLAYWIASDDFKFEDYSDYIASDVLSLSGLLVKGVKCEPVLHALLDKALKHSEGNEDLVLKLVACKLQGVSLVARAIALKQFDRAKFMIESDSYAPWDNVEATHNELKLAFKQNADEGKISMLILQKMAGHVCQNNEDKRNSSRGGIFGDSDKLNTPENCSEYEHS